MKFDEGTGACAWTSRVQVTSLVCTVIVSTKLMILSQTHLTFFHSTRVLKKCLLVRPFLYFSWSDVVRLVARSVLYFLLNNIRGHSVPFLCTTLFQKEGHYSRGDIIKGRTLIKEIRYLKNFKFYVLNVPPILWKRGDIIQGRTLYKGGHYLRKYSTYYQQKRCQHYSFCLFNAALNNDISEINSIA